VVHAHFYQPFRVDPFTGRVPPDPSAAPFRDWNERVTEECYRPNAELGTLRHASWNLGPTLTAYLAEAAPDVLAGFAEGDRLGGGAADGPGLAQSFHHSILPLLPAHDRRTEVLWGLRDFEHRFGRRARGMWLPETAADLATLRTLADAGVEATILAPWQAAVAHLDDRRPYRVDTGGGSHVAVAFYDAELSGAVSFDPAVTADADRFARERVLPRLAAPLPDGSAPSLVIASDGELYGHHQSFRDLFLQRLVAPSPGAPDRGFDVVSLAGILAPAAGHALPEARIRDRTSWSCHHGVLRWSAECPCARDGSWKGPLRDALVRLAGAIDAVTEAIALDLRGLDDPWAARDGFADVVIGARPADAFAVDHLGRRSTAEARARLLALMEAQRWRLGMFASCGWFWEDPTRFETRQVLRAAARAVRIVDKLAGTDLETRLIGDLTALVSPGVGIDGATIYRRALSEVGQPPPGVAPAPVDGADEPRGPLAPASPVAAGPARTRPPRRRATPVR
jgi:hypothetical protein